MDYSQSLYDELVSSKSDPKVLFSRLHEIWRENERNDKSDNQQLSGLLLRLNRDEGTDFCQTAVLAISKELSVFDIVFILDNSISKMNLNLESTLTFAEALLDGMKNDLLSSRQYKPFENLVVEQPKFAREFLSELLKQDKPSDFTKRLNTSQSCKKITS